MSKKPIRPRPCICAYCGKRIYKYQQAGYIDNTLDGKVVWLHDCCASKITLKSFQERIQKYLKEEQHETLA